MLQIIQAPIKEELRQFEKYFKETIKSDLPFLSSIINYILRAKGKKIRPLLVFLSAKMLGKVTEKTFIGATSIEMLHTATLIHDDIVDESYERRGFFSVNAIWRNKLAVLIGDYILAKGLTLNLDDQNYHFLSYISRTVKDMSEGEITQMKKSKNPDFLFDTYFDIIRKKTASLIATSLAIGALSSNADEETVEKMFQIGLDIGIAFQIKDDIFDYQEKGILGKPTGNDLREQKITLPLLYVLKQIPYSEKVILMRKVKSKNKSQSKINEIIDLVVKSGGIEYSIEQMNYYKNQAIAALSCFPDSECKNSLISLIDYITVRNN